MGVIERRLSGATRRDLSESCVDPSLTLAISEAANPHPAWSKLLAVCQVRCQFHFKIPIG